MARSKARPAKRAPVRAPAAKKKAARKSATKSATKSVRKKTGSVSPKAGANTVVKRGAKPRSTTAAKKAGKARAKPTQAAWVSVPDPASPADQLRVSVPAGSARPNADRDEAAYNAQVLHDNQQISRAGALRPGETHAIEETSDGDRQLVRKRFSTI